MIHSSHYLEILANNGTSLDRTLIFLNLLSNLHGLDVALKLSEFTFSGTFPPSFE